MKIFIDTTLNDLVVALFDSQYKLINYVLETELKEKSEKLPLVFKNLLERNNFSLQNINSFYINLGPGTFTGSRIALVFCRTIAQLSNINIYTTSSFNLVSLHTKNKEIAYIDARGKSSYKALVQKGKILSDIEVVERNQNWAIDYLEVINNFFNYQKLFKLEENLLEIQPIYVKKPHIG
ncbi:tRNA (adenosine(37)-N6)-threonylcarbamoyltransferase complex dimerization subunit type 1 TsaB [Mycoplasma sp. 5370]